MLVLIVTNTSIVHQASDEVQTLHDRQSRVLQEQAKTSMQKICRDMTSKGKHLRLDSRLLRRGRAKPSSSVVSLQKCEQILNDFSAFRP